MIDRLTRADLTSGVGALVLGIGVGALFARSLESSAAALTLLGGVLHGLGMWDKHRLTPSPADDARWIRGLYWACWLLLALAVLVVLGRALG
jgi:hypothetical protein